jgi:hypothetical protein
MPMAAAKGSWGGRNMRTNPIQVILHGEVVKSV